MTRLPFHPPLASPPAEHHPVRVLSLGLLMALLLLLVLPIGCTRGASAGRETAAAPAVGHVVEEEAGVSLHDLPVEFRDQRGTPRTLASLDGRARVVALVYTSCAHTCPLVVADLKRLEAALPAGHADAVEFVLVSLDPARDTPERLAQFAATARLAPERWTLLTGSDDDVRALAAVLAVRYRAGRGGAVDHSNVITVVDAGGAMVHQEVGVGGDPTALHGAVTRLLAAE